MTGVSDKYIADRVAYCRSLTDKGDLRTETRGCAAISLEYHRLVRSRRCAHLGNHFVATAIAENEVPPCSYDTKERDNDYANRDGN